MSVEAVGARNDGWLTPELSSAAFDFAQQIGITQEAAEGVMWLDTHQLAAGYRVAKDDPQALDRFRARMTIAGEAVSRADPVFRGLLRTIWCRVGSEGIRAAVAMAGDPSLCHLFNDPSLGVDMAHGIAIQYDTNLALVKDAQELGVLDALLHGPVGDPVALFTFMPDSAFKMWRHPTAEERREALPRTTPIVDRTVQDTRL